MDAARAIFAADASKLPAFAGSASPDGGYTLYKIAGVTPAANGDPRVAMLTQQYARLVSEEEFGSWLAAQRARHDIKLNKSLIDSKEHP